jgi:hypothetical protein
LDESQTLVSTVIEGLTLPIEKVFIDEWLKSPVPPHAFKINWNKFLAIL